MTADTVGGVWTYALELTHALARHGVAVTLATMGAPLTREQRAQARRHPGLDVVESTYALEWMPEPWRDVAAAGDWLLELAAARDPDVVHVNGYAHGALSWRAPTVVVGHSCVCSWWEAVHGSDAPPEWDRYRAAVAAGLGAADVVVAPTSAMLDALRRHYGPLPHGRVVPNGRHLWAPASGMKRDLVLAAGRMWDEAKNLASVVAAAPRLPWPVYVAGPTMAPAPSCRCAGRATPWRGGSGRPATRAPSGDRSRRRPRSARFLGRLDEREMQWWLARAAVFLAPARYEPFGLAILEAALARCALVLGDVASLRETWDGAAVFVPPDDVNAIRAAVTRLVTTPSLRRALGGRARARGRELTPRAMAAGYLAAYRDAGARHGAAEPRDPDGALIPQEVPACAS